MTRPTRPIDTTRMFIIPLLILFFTTVLIGYITFSVTVRRFKETIVQSGMTLSMTLSQAISENLVYKDSFIRYIDERIISIGYYILDHRTQISNEFLDELTHTFTLTHIYWYNPLGEIIYDAKNEYVGWKAQTGDPIDTFMNSGLNVFVEDIRKSTDEDAYYKFIYMRDTDGYFLQLGIEADVIYELTRQYEYQTIIERFVNQNPEILYALVVDKNYMSIADTDLEDIGVDYTGDEAYKLALQGRTTSSEWFYEKIGENILEISTPLYYKGQIVAVLGVGFVYNSYYEMQSFLALTTFAMMIAVMLIYTIVQMTGVIDPLRKFSTRLEAIDLDHIEYRQVTKEDGVLSGISQVFTKLLNNVFDKEQENKYIIDKISTLAFTDQLTGLPNRNGSINYFNTLIESKQNIAVIYLDIDNFKLVNDTRGHYFGDLLIQNIGFKLNNTNIDNIYVSRHQGDEFVIVISFEKEDELEASIQYIKSQFFNPITIEDYNINVECSMGVALYPQDGQTLEDLLLKADMAMYEAKKPHHIKHVYFNQSMNEKLIRTQDIVLKLNEAILQDGFYIVYQPQVEVSTKKIVGLEALLRLKHSDMLPDEFIPIAEHHRLINKIGRSVIENVIKQQSMWIDQKKDIVPIFVNFSSIQLQDPCIDCFIKELLEKYRVPAAMFGIELSEITVLEHKELAKKILTKINDLGVKIAIDDFGSGETGINYMTYFPIDIIKFVQSFSKQYLHAHTINIYHTFIKLAHDFGFTTLAEGIETQEQMDLLNETACHIVQGFYYHKPMSIEDVSNLLTKKKK